MIKVIKSGVFSTKVCKGVRVDIIIGKGGSAILEYTEGGSKKQLKLTKTTLLEADWGTFFKVFSVPNPGYVSVKVPDPKGYKIKIMDPIKINCTFKAGVVIKPLVQTPADLFGL